MRVLLYGLGGFILARLLYYQIKIQYLKKIIRSFDFIVEKGNDLAKEVPKLECMFQEAQIPIGTVEVDPSAPKGSRRISALANIDHLRVDIIHMNLYMLDQLLYYYLVKRNETFNPLYWLKGFTWFPRLVLDSLRLQLPRSVYYFLQVLYWAMMISIGFICAGVIPIDRILAKIPY